MWSNPQLPLKPRKTADYNDHCITIQLPARQGKVLAVGYKNGKEVMRDSLVNHGPVADVRLDADYSVLAAAKADYSEVSPMKINNSAKGKAAKGKASERKASEGNLSTPWSTVSHIRLTLVDKEGHIQQMQPKKFRVEVEGPIRLLGVETGDMRRMESWRTNELKTYFGEGLVRLQSTPQKGIAKVMFFVEGFDKPFVKEIVIK